MGLKARLYAIDCRSYRVVDSCFGQGILPSISLWQLFLSVDLES
jgi:hypothetical protein